MTMAMVKMESNLLCSSMGVTGSEMTVAPTLLFRKTLSDRIRQTLLCCLRHNDVAI
jgi:hypothetical protein